MLSIALAMLLQAQPPSSGLIEGEPPAILADLPNLTVLYYPVVGDDPQAVRRSMNARRPRDPKTGEAFDGRTDTAFTYRAPGRPNGGCDTSAAVFTHAIRIILPRLAEPERLSRAERADWDRYMARLVGHERNHALIGVRGGAELERRVKAAQDCEGAKTAVEAVTTTMAAAHRQYDAKTEHGGLEGAVYPSGSRAAPRPGRVR